MGRMRRRMSRKRRLSLVVLATLLALSAGPSASLTSSAARAEERQAAREQVGKPVQAAQQLLKQKKFGEALAKLQQADAVAGKTPYETYVIAATRAAVTLDAGDSPGAIKALETVLSTGILPPPEAVKRIAILAELSYRVKDYPAVVAHAERYSKEGGKDEEPRLLMAQAYFLQNDFADAATTSRAVLHEEEAAGRPPGEAVLQMLASSEYRQKNESGYVDALKQLVGAYPKPQYWRDLLSAVQHKPGFSDRFALDIDRLMAATGAMDAPGQYMEAAQLALQAGLPGDAKVVLDKGYAAGVLGKGEGADRQQRLAEMARRQSSEDSKGLAQLAQEAAAAPDGLPWVKLGEAYASYGQYEKAIPAFQEGIKKGGLKSPDDAKLHLGIAYLHAKQPAKAKEVLGAVKSADGARDLAQLWLIEAGVK